MMLYRVLRWTMSVYFRARLKIRFEGEENVPDKGPFVLVLSHQSHLDSLLLHTFCPRLMFTLAKSRYLEPGSWPGSLRGWARFLHAAIRLTHRLFGWRSD